MAQYSPEQPTSPRAAFAAIFRDIETDDQAHKRPPKYCAVHITQAMIPVVANVYKCPICG